MSLGVPRVASMTISFARPLFRLVTTRMYIYRWLAGYLILRVGFGFAAGFAAKKARGPVGALGPTPPGRFARAWTPGRASKSRQG